MMLQQGDGIFPRVVAPLCNSIIYLPALGADDFTSEIKDPPLSICLSIPIYICVRVCGGCGGRRWNFSILCCRYYCNFARNAERMNFTCVLCFRETKQTNESTPPKLEDCDENFCECESDLRSDPLIGGATRRVCEERKPPLGSHLVRATVGCSHGRLKFGHSCYPKKKKKIGHSTLHFASL
ncbi:hypothetical protein NMG60_11013114 [Bertholletia excelsa]